jgi:hypothetical protein
MLKSLSIQKPSSLTNGIASQPLKDTPFSYPDTNTQIQKYIYPTKSDSYYNDSTQFFANAFDMEVAQHQVFDDMLSMTSKDGKYIIDFILAPTYKVTVTAQVREEQGVYNNVSIPTHCAKKRATVNGLTPMILKNSLLQYFASNASQHTTRWWGSDLINALNYLSTSYIPVTFKFMKIGNGKPTYYYITSVDFEYNGLTFANFTINLLEV